MVLITRAITFKILMSVMGGHNKLRFGVPLVVPVTFKIMISEMARTR